ncbi:MAG TPA: EamA family transporter [Candidatus Binatia bacterium]
MGETLAIVASFCFAFSNVFNRRGLATSNAVTASLISLGMSAAALWALAPFFVSHWKVQTLAGFYFLSAGIFAPGLGRFFNFKGMERVGMARAVSITNTYPMVASMLAVVIMGETWTLQNFLGTSLVVAGVVVLSWKETGQSSWRKVDLIYPAMAAISFGIASNLRKLGLLVDGVPVMGAALTSTTGLLCGLLVLQLQGGKHRISLSRRSIGWFFAAGLANTAAMLSVFYALNSSKVVLVEPLVGANPVLALILSMIFLRDLEAVTMRVVSGAVCTVAGSILVVTA